VLICACEADAMPDSRLQDLGFAVADEWHPWVSDGDGANGTTAVIVGYTVAFGGASKDFR